MLRTLCGGSADSHDLEVTTFAQGFSIELKDIVVFPSPRIAKKDPAINENSRPDRAGRFLLRQMRFLGAIS